MTSPLTRPALAAIWHRPPGGTWQPKVYRTRDPDFRLAMLAALAAGPTHARIEYLDPRSPLAQAHS